MPVTTRIVTFSIGNPYKPSFVTVTGWGVDLRYIHIPRLPGEYLLRFGVLSVCFWGPNTSSQGVWKARGISDKLKSPFFARDHGEI